MNNSFFDIAFSESSNSYESSLDEGFKKDHGIFYTDLELADSMVKFLKIPKKSRLIDPYCGTGSFIHTLLQNSYNNVVGCDFDYDTVQTCKRLTGASEIYQVDTLGKTGQEILSTIGSEPFDYVIGNPPYAPIGKNVTLNGERAFINKVNTSGSNLFIAALYRSFELCKDNGYISFIIPKNLLHISSYKEIRHTLLKEKRIVSIVELGIHFKTVRGEQIILTLQNSYKKGNKIKFYTYNKGEIEFLSEVAQSYYKDEIIVFTGNDEVPIYDMLREQYGTLQSVCSDTIRRGHDTSSEALRGKQIRKFGFKDRALPHVGTQIFIQNIFSAEAGITASYAGDLKPSETITVVKLDNEKMCKYVLGLLHSRLCNYFLIRFGFNNSRLTIHTDAKYLNKIPIVVDHSEMYNQLINLVVKIENTPYMSSVWFALNEQLNKLVYKIYSLDQHSISYIEKEMKKISAAKWYGV